MGNRHPQAVRGDPLTVDHVLVELDTFRPVLLQCYAAKAHLLDEEAHDTVLHGELLVGSMRGLPKPHHPGVVKIYDYIVSEQTYFIVMEFVDGVEQATFEVLNPHDLSKLAEVVRSSSRAASA